ncbi:MAG: hypothetical protein KA368_23260 [Acidobacteria bacterium]|nr:hypothetical protein [Acidobacteriota bacterium]
MKIRFLLHIAGVAILFLACTEAVQAQWDKKPYTEWQDKDVLKMLNDSPWGKTQSFVANTELSGSGRAGRVESITDTFQINFRVRLFSSRPIRQAFARQMEKKLKGNISEEQAAQLKTFTTGDFNEYIVVTVSCDSEQRGLPLQDALMLLQKRTTADLKADTYLEVAGQKVYLQEYQAPRNDGFGARFIFPRLVNNEPFITSKTNEIHFYSEFSGQAAGRSGPASGAGAMNYTLNVRFKVSAMNFLGKLEY